jgi:hypothetical protein
MLKCVQKYRKQKMFEKLLSVLPFNPTATYQLGFYARRMREESLVRRSGLLFIVLAFLVQFFAVISPSVATVADSTNDLVNGGFTSIAEAQHDCQTIASYGTVLANYGISCSDIARGTTLTLKSTDIVDGSHLYSVGYNPLGATNPDTHKPTNETPANLVGLSRPIYWRLLDNWDSGAYSSYQMIRVTSSVTGRVFYLMYRCGNLVYPGVPPSIPPCPYNKAILSGTPQCVKPAPKPVPVPTPKPTPIVYCAVPGKTTLPASSSQCYTPCLYNSTVPTTSPLCKPCTSATGSADTLACVQIGKSATDQTQGWTTTGDAPRPAQPNDIIVYTLTAKNDGKGTVSKYVMQEDLSDVMDYATVQDVNGGTLDSSSGEIVWPAVDIKATTTLTHTVTVKVMSVIPDTPASISDPGHFDSVMTNVYGNTVNIPVPENIIKTASVVTTTQLPNTGPGTSLFVGAGIVIVAGYFYSRSRLLAKEARLVLQTTSGDI